MITLYYIGTMPLSTRILVMCLLLFAGTARAGGDPVSGATVLEPAVLQARVEWNPAWERVRTWEFIAAPLVIGGALALRFAGPQPPRNWQGGILFDDAITSAVAVRGTLRASIVTYTDLAFYGAMSFRLVDSALLPGSLWYS